MTDNYFDFLPFPMEAEPEKPQPEALTISEALKRYRAGKPVVVKAIGLFDIENGHTWTDETVTTIARAESIRDYSGVYEPHNFKAHLQSIKNFICAELHDGSRTEIFKYYAN